MDWHVGFDQVSQYVMKIETPSGYGTGFLCHYSDNKELIGIATAKHVIEYADYWKQDIRIISLENEVFLKNEDRFIVQAEDDTAMILCANQFEDRLPKGLIPLIPEDNHLKIGVEVGWIGFPHLGVGMHFFSGNISAFNQNSLSYFIDGVTISGVSGGPVFCSNENGKFHIIGSISAYIPNNATGEPLPGLSIAQDVTQFHEMVKNFKDLDEATHQDEQSE